MPTQSQATSDVATDPRTLAALVEATGELVASVSAAIRAGTPVEVLRETMAKEVIAQCAMDPTLDTETLATIIAILVTELADVSLFAALPDPRDW